jgi:hypothetical protein
MYVEENVFGAKPETGLFSRTAKIIESLGVVTRRAALRCSVNPMLTND